MANRQQEFGIGTQLASASFKDKAYRRVKLDANGEWTLTGAGERGSGVIQDEPEAGQACNVTIHGISPMVAGGAFAAGAELQSDAQGRAIVLGAGVRIGTAIEESTALGQIISTLLD